MNVNAIREKLAAIKQLVAEVEALLPPDESPKEITPMAVVLVATRYFKLTEGAILSKDRYTEVSRARRTCAYLLHHYTDLTLREIGAVLNINHASAGYAVSEIGKELDDGLFDTRQQLQDLGKLLGKPFVR